MTMLLVVPVFASASIDNNLYYGLQKNSDVKQLQEFLIDKGFLTGSATGNFYSLTLKAVKAYQTSVGVSSTGYVGNLTRKSINDELASELSASNQEAVNETGTTPPASTTPTTAPTPPNDLMTSLQAQITALEQQIASMQQQNTAQQPSSNPPPKPAPKSTPAPIPTPACPQYSVAVCGSDAKTYYGNYCLGYNMPSGIAVASQGACATPTPTCNPNWQCGSWSACTSSQQTRTCSDSNNCNTANGEPTLTQSCIVSTPTSNETYVYDNYYPIILSLSDNQGNITKASNYNGYRGSYSSIKATTPLNIGDVINLTVQASDPQNRQILYGFGLQYKDAPANIQYAASNQFSYQITSADLAGSGGTLRIVAYIKSAKDYYRYTGLYDDNIFLDYTLLPPPTSTCTPNWQCSGWSTCTNSQQTQTCNDLNNCNTTSGEPNLTQTCSMPISIEQQKAAQIISVSDNLGNTHQMNCEWSQTHYECSPEDNKVITVSVASTPQITFTVNAQDPNNRPLKYNYYYEGGCETPDGRSNWVTTNSCTTDLTKYKFGQQVFGFYVDNDDNYGSIGLDADAALHYDIEQ